MKIALVIFIIIISLTYFWKYRDNVDMTLYQEFWEENYPTTKNNVELRDEIFVSISNFKDKEIINTVKSLIQNRSHFKVNIVVFEQIDDWDVSLLDTHQPENVTILKIPHTISFGHNWARYVIQSHWNGEKYYLQCSSSTLFPVGWDTTLVDKLNLLPPSSVITINKINDPLFNSDFSFCSGQIIKDAPYDPYLPYISKRNEELDITMRLFSRGWKFYNYSIMGIILNKDTVHNTIDDLVEPIKLKTMLTMSMIRLYHKLGYRKGLMSYGVEQSTGIPVYLKNNIHHYNLGYWKTYKDYRIHLKKTI